jgi:hypothetical protein
MKKNIVKIHSHDFAKKIPAKDIAKKFEALVQKTN